jgi:hypothetical protein
MASLPLPSIGYNKLWDHSSWKKSRNTYYFLTGDAANHMARNVIPGRRNKSHFWQSEYSYTTSSVKCFQKSDMAYKNLLCSVHKG